jgi:hypothetical protein
MFNSKFSYGVLKHPGYNGKSDPPPAPDYAAAARETAAGNLEAARATTAANRVNQVTPYGNLTYSISGKDSYGNDMYTANQTLTPAQQKILEQNQGLSSGLLNTAQQGLDYAGGLLAKPGIDMASLPQVGINPGETYSDAIMRRLQPQIEQERQASDAALANQGIAQGTQAYENAKRQLAMSQNDRQLGAITSGMGVGLQANQQAFGQQGYNQMQPINVINALRTGSQVQAPSYVSVPQQANVAGPDILSATGAQYNAEVNATNAANAGAGSFMGGLMNLASTGAKLYAGSDQSIKENIIKIGSLDNGINIYKFEYRPEYKDTWGHGTHIGVMAQEVEKVIPKAVATHKDGYKLVNYSLLGA